MKELCFWSVGDGDYAIMLQGLVDSFKQVGMKEDFHVFSDREIRGAETHIVGAFDKKNFFFKHRLLQTQVKEWNYKYFAYLDADTLFLRKPSNVLEVMQGSAVHFFLENDCTLVYEEHKDWWGCPLQEYVRMMRECGVTSDKVYNLNSGFFIVKREAVDVVCELALDFWKYAAQQGYFLPDEPSWAYAMHMLCDQLDLHLLSKYKNLWCSDWEGIFARGLPDGRPWVLKDYMTKEPSIVNPAIVHLVKSKQLLIKPKNGD